MKVKKLLKFLCFFIVTVPFAAGCQGTRETNLNGHHSQKYLLAGRLDASDNVFNYYAINNDTEYAVSLKEAYTNNTDDIYVPDEYNNKPVTGIYRSAFYKSRSPRIYLPNTITVIDYEAFLGSRIQTITIPFSVSQIGEGAFYSCKYLTKAAIQNSSTTSEASSACSCSEIIDNGGGERTYSTLKTIPSFCFFNCVAMKELVLPESIEEIEYEAFNGCSALFSTLAFMNIKAIRSRAFQNCSALKNVYISRSFFEEDENNEPVGVIEEHAFNGCNDALTFHLVGDNDTVTTWLNLSRNLYRWNVKNEFNDPELSSNRFTYDITTSGASYSNDWIYTTDNNNDVEITSYIGPTDIEGTPVRFLSIPNELPSGSGHYVRKIAVNALDTVKASLNRLYLPKSLWRIENSFFGSGYTNLTVIDDNTTCALDETNIQGGSSLTPRIILNGLTSLKVIGAKAFIDLPSLVNIKKLYLPYSLEAVGSFAFGNGASSSASKRHMRNVTDFRWDYDDDLSVLKVIGEEAFFAIGRNDASNSITSGEPSQGHVDASGNERYQLTTLVFPRTFKGFGVTSSDASTHGLSITDTNFNNRSAFAGSPLLYKVVFKGSKKSKVQSSPNSTDSATTNLMLGYNTFAMNNSLRTIIFEERCGRNIFFLTENKYQPTIGWSSGKYKNDFSGDPALQTLVLPNKYTTLRFQNYALQGNSRAVMYLSGAYATGNSSKIRGVTTHNNAAYINYINNVNTDACDIASDAVKRWRTIGDEGYDDTVGVKEYTGYDFQGDITKNYFGIDQKMPMYENIHYIETINVPGINVDVEVGIGNTKEYAESNKCAFVTGTESGKATMTKYLYDRWDSSFTGTARVPATVNNSQNSSFTVNAIGDSAFSAAYCDSDKITNYKDDTLHKDLTAVEIPDTIAKIGEYAFMRAYGITKVSAYNVSTNNLIGNYIMPSSLAEIGKLGLAFCNIEQILNIPNNCLFYENTHATTYEVSVFANNFSLRKVTFGNNSTSSTYYETSTYTHDNSSDIYTSAVYSKAGVTYNASSLLVVLNRNSDDKLKPSGDVSDDPVTIGNETVHYSKFNGQYADYFSYGAFKMCHWVDSLVVGNAIDNTLNQPLISGLDKIIYLNETYDFTADDRALKSISFGSAGMVNTSPYSFEGCSNLVMIELPRIPDATIPAGLFSAINNENLVFKVPSDNTGINFKVCEKGVLDLTYTGYAGIEDGAFRGSTIKEIIAPITTDFTVGVDAFGDCTSLESIDFSNVTDTVYLNGSFRGATLSSTMFDFGSQAFIYFGDETFKGAAFTDNTFVFPAKTAKIGKSCFEECDVKDNELKTVTAEANLMHLERFTSDTGLKENYEGDTTGFREIGNFAFYLCKHLNNFDFSKFTEVERIGHYAFGMIKYGDDGIIPLPENHSQMASNARITSDGVINFNANLKSLGCGAFNSTAITAVTINSTAIKFERGGTYTSETRCKAVMNNGLNNGCHQFRHCDNLISVIFTVSNCALFSESDYLFKNDNGQENFFSWCNNLQFVVLPTGYDIQHFTGSGSGGNVRPDSMFWGSKTSCKVYTYYTAKRVYDNGGTVNIYWRRTGNNTTCDMVYYVANNASLAYIDNGEWKLCLSNQQYWTLRNGVVTYLGTATINKTTGLVTFKQNSVTIATADANGITFAS